MKKTYIIPQALIVDIMSEGMMAASLSIGSTDSEGSTEKITDDSQWLSNRNGWSSNNWSETGDED